MTEKQKGNKNNRQGNQGSQLFASIITAIISAVVSAVVVGLISHFSWSAQYKTTLEEKIDDKKFEVYKQVSSNMAKHQLLLYSKLKVKLTAYSETIGKSLTVEEYKALDERLQENLPLEYTDMLEYDKNLPELYGSFYMAEAMFGDSTDKALINYMNNILNKSPEQYLNEFISAHNLKAGETYTIATKDFIDFVEPVVNSAREQVMESMRDDIGAFK
ncbi:hypothetical protein RB620_07720 [Paenibacillus sp. LHD-117]|uniref:hypothetical protein n=1 Tax=Paenibacillus sp. LHD-117 TaxID=3071412 RepID=UPI0027E0047D|nr:hypothetical protein [Paenibacillus sp. LHD-117]MDQ6419329.1 hypothetical protein [Paenibacillus sp. LHD-117]